MKNVSMNIVPILQPTLAPPMPAQQTLAVPSIKIEAKELYSVSFSAQFDIKEKALLFAKTMLNEIQNYGE